MRCFACDSQVSSNALDSKTNRYYCEECFAFTVEEMLSQDRKSFVRSIMDLPPDCTADAIDAFSDPLDLDEILEQFEKDNPLDLDEEDQINYNGEQMIIYIVSELYGHVSIPIKAFVDRFKAEEYLANDVPDGSIIDEVELDDGSIS